ncbi:amidohydrolase 3 [Myriangium duriaei CBS 260.36]|uniref:Amidohydrolase 3 n=1 Tax=Myriangium duriaei CBS 260.36 TaxID=1168546 RepID=A0A9P4IYI9_9PEZI|nr:amidohydrolase 3 [Myriangium duriaei CBS 260.36]
MLVLRNGRFIVLDGKGNDTQASFTDCMIVESGSIEFVGSFHQVPQELLDKADEVIDLDQKVVTPGFIDGHMHLLLLGQALEKVDLRQCKNLDDIRATIKSFAVANPLVPRIMCKGWLEEMTEIAPHRSMLDDIDPRPIVIDSNSLHSAWCNTAALKELGVEDLPNPPGGTIYRDIDGVATGLLGESVVFSHVWPHLSKVSGLRERVKAIKAAISAYSASGYTGIIEMAMDEYAWEALQELLAEEKPPMRICAHWLIRPLGTLAETLDQVRRAIELHHQNALSDCHIVGIKVICDGTIDTCTAALASTYGSMTSLVEPLWSKELLEAVVKLAAQARLQCALHAIGDEAVKMAIDVLESHGHDTSSPKLRHRIEHLELTTEEDARRLGALGITASIQPVHSDPAALRAWPRLIGNDRCARAFAYKDFEDHGSVLAMGSDSPTAPFDPLINMYIATTRRSVKDPSVVPMVGHRILTLASALAAATSGSAYSCHAERRTGRLEKGLKADFCILDMQWNADDLLSASVVETWFEGKCVWRK